MAFQNSGVRVYFGAVELLASFAFQMLEILPGESNCTFQALTGLAAGPVAWPYQRGVSDYGCSLSGPGGVPAGLDGGRS